MTSSQQASLRHSVLNSLRACVKYAEPDRPFVLRSGAESDVYIDCKSLLSTAEARRDVASLVEGVVSGLFCFDALGIALFGGAPLAYALSHDVIGVRPQQRDHGVGDRVIWPENLDPARVLAGPKVLLLEDVVTSGASIVEAWGTIKQDWCRLQPKLPIMVVGVVALVDREMGGRELIERELDVPLVPLFRCRPRSGHDTKFVNMV